MCYMKEVTDDYTTEVYSISHVTAIYNNILKKINSYAVSSNSSLCCAILIVDTQNCMKSSSASNSAITSDISNISLDKTSVPPLSKASRNLLRTNVLAMTNP